MVRRSAKLRRHDVSALFDHQLAPGLAEDRERDLVPHQRGREVDALVLPEELGRALLEREHRRILALLLVTDLGVRHGLAHRLRRLRLCVGAEIDHRESLEA